MTFPRSQHAVIYADPPWKYEMYSEKGKGRSPDSHYECLSIEQLKAMRDDVLFATAPDAVCIMWATWPMLKQAIELMACWGFQYKTAGHWTKLTRDGRPHMGTGYVMRGAGEPYLVGTIGNPCIKNHATRNVLFSGEVPEDLRDLSVMLNTVRREHSRKPDEMIPVIEALFDGPYLEMFARQQRPGWDSWGNQTEKFEVRA